MSRNTPVTDIANELCRAPGIESFGQFTARTNAAVERVVGMPGAMTQAASSTRSADGMSIRMQQARIQLWHIEQEVARLQAQHARELRNFGSIALQYLRDRQSAATSTTGLAAPQPWEPPPLNRLEVEVPVRPRGLLSGLEAL